MSDDGLGEIQNASDEAAAAAGCWFDLKRAARIGEFFRRFLRHGKGKWAGKPFELQDWQYRRVIAPLFGWVRADGTRRFRTAYISIAKKNGKSTLGAGIALALLMADKEAGAEIYSAAADKYQAGIVFREALSMVRQSPALDDILTVVESKGRMVWEAANSFYQTLSADVPTKDGLNIHGLIFDELHSQQNRELYDKLIYGGAARTQPLIVSLTTAGFDRNSICWEIDDYAVKVRDSVIADPDFFQFIARAEPEDDWTDPKTWYKANPSLGVTLTEEEMGSACRQAQQSPAKENGFRRYRLNQWTEQDVRWISIDAWNACEGIVEPEKLAGRECFGGLDLSSSRDITALVLDFPPIEGDLIHRLLCWFWIPGDDLADRQRRDRVPYDVWIKSGHIRIAGKKVVDYDQVRKEINEIGQIFNIKEIAVDRWNATQTMKQLDEDGFTIVGFGQGFQSMTAPTKELDRLVAEKQIAHGGNPVLRWMASNVSLETDAAGNLKPSKKKSTGRIDGIVGAIMGIGRAMVAPPPPELQIQFI